MQEWQHLAPKPAPIRTFCSEFLGFCMGLEVLTSALQQVLWKRLQVGTSTKSQQMS